MTGDVRRTTFGVAGGYEISLAEMGEGPAVLFLHGSGPGASGASNFKLNAPAFAAAGYRVLLPDMIGYGASSKPEGIDYTLQLFTDTVLDALDQAGVTSAVIVGNSLGGAVAMQIALDRPGYATKLVMMAPGCIEDLPVYFAMPGIARMKSSFGSPDFSLEDQRALITNLMHPSVDPALVTDELVAERYAVARTQSKDVLARMRTPNLAPRLGELTMPILGFWGLDDAFCPASGAQRFLDACPDARFMTFTHVGHWVQVERAAEFNRYAIAFIDG
jgi:4,5:9,10-diseco-3-hydroxy-5,9,17-trioxoandrosta-1(10),2-diene-4-oate hydrolase